jgi:GNAT superfamily N-acetyltransferase
MTITVRKLDVADAAMVDSFDCGESALNEYLKRYAAKNQELYKYGITYIALSSEFSDQILGYYTISNSSIPRARMPDEVVKGLPRYSDIPAILLARFAVNKNFSGHGVGHILMSHALDLTISVSQVSAARYIYVESYDSAITWYAKYGFQEIKGSIEPNRRKMYLDLKVVEKGREVAIQTLFSSTNSVLAP